MKHKLNFVFIRVWGSTSFNEEKGHGCKEMKFEVAIEPNNNKNRLESHRVQSTW